MIIDQDEIEALLAQAGEGSEPEPAQSQPEAPSQPPQPGAPPVVASSPEVARLLRLKVPVIVELAARRMDIGTVRSFSLGMIIEFEKSVDDPLQLLINNQPIGEGEAVKVGEHFGLRVTAMRDRSSRIRSMGG